MPKFYCMHCGQHIDAPDELAGGHTSCPTCGGDIMVPMIPQRIVLPSEAIKAVAPSEKNPESSSGFWSFRSLIATIAAGALCLIAALSTGAWGIYFVFGNTLGRLLGVMLAALVLAVVGAGIMTASKKRFVESFSQYYSIGILAISGLSLVGSLLFKSPAFSYSKYASPREIESARSAVVGIQNDIQTMLKETRQPDGTPVKATVNFEALPAASGDLQRIRELMQSFLKDMVGFQNSYLESLKENGLDTLLNADRVAQDDGFIHSRMTLARLKRTVTESRSKAMGLLESFPNRIKTINFTSQSDQQALNGYKNGLETALPLFKENWDLEKKVVEHIEELIAHLEATRYSWKAEQGKFMFERNVDLETFNEIMDKITVCSTRQNEIREKSIKSSMDKIDRLKDLIPD